MDNECRRGFLGYPVDRRHLSRNRHLLLCIQLHKMHAERFCVHRWLCTLKVKRGGQPVQRRPPSDLSRLAVVEKIGRREKTSDGLHPRTRSLDWIRTLLVRLGWLYALHERQMPAGGAAG